MDAFRLAVGFLIVFGLLALLLVVSRRAKNKGTSFVNGLLLLKNGSFRLRRELGRKGGLASATNLQVERQHCLTPSHQLHVVTLDGQRLLLCTHPQGCSLLQQAPHIPGHEFAQKMEEACR
jgi:hypothetical protein